MEEHKNITPSFVKQFALDMRQAFPNETGFSDTNVKYMKRWYSFYFERVTKSHQLGDQLEMPPLGVATYQLQEVVDRTIAEIENENKEM